MTTATTTRIYLDPEYVDVILKCVAPFTENPKNDNVAELLTTVNLQLRHLDAQWGLLAVCATDGSRLACYEREIPLRAEETPPFNINVPYSFFENLESNWRKKTRGVLAIDIDEKAITARAALFTVDAALYKADYPRYQELFPTRGKWQTWVIELLPIMDKGKRPAKKDSATGYTMGDEAKLISRIKPDFPHAGMTIVFKPNDANTKISLAGRNIPWSYSSIVDAVMTEGIDRLEVTFNPEYLAQMFDSFSGAVKMESNGPLKPAVFTCTGIKGLRHLLMPVQVK